MLLGFWQTTRLLHFRHGFLRLLFLCTLFRVDFLFSVVTLNGHSRDSVVPRLLTPHPHLEWPEAGSAALQEEVQQVGAAGRHVQVHVEVLAHAIWTFVVFWSDLVAQLTTMVRLMVMRDSKRRDPHTGTATGSWITMG